MTLIYKLQHDEDLSPHGYSNEILRSINHIESMQIRGAWAAAQKENVESTNHRSAGPTATTAMGERQKLHDMSPHNLEEEYECLGMQQQFIEDDGEDPRQSRSASSPAPEHTSLSRQQPSEEEREPQDKLHKERKN